MARLFSRTSQWLAINVLSVMGCTSAPPEPVSVRASLATSAPVNDVATTSFKATELSALPAPSPTPKGMVWVPGGEFSMGSADPSAGGHCHEPMDDARPIHRVSVSGFFIDSTEVTNESFRKFVDATGYVTLAERTPTAAELPGVPAAARVAGSSVFTPPSSPVRLDQPLSWWRYVPGANWQQPLGPGSSLAGLDNHPVVHVSYADALAYAHWANKDLPTEAEWEFAARGGRTGQLYPWGNEAPQVTSAKANIYQGQFPTTDTAEDGYAGTAPVGSYPANDFGLYDTAGNVWEWTRDWYAADSYSQAHKQGIVRDPRGPNVSFDPSEPGTEKRVQRGGSWLCTNEYCTRYMVGMRGKGEPNSPSNHIGFRCIRRL